MNLFEYIPRRLRCANKHTLPLDTPPLGAVLFIKSKKCRWLFAVLGMVVLAGVWRDGYLGKAIALRGVAAWAARGPASAEKAGLAEYRAVIEAKPIAGVSGQASSLTYSPQTKTLFTTLNSPPFIVELSTTGEMLRKIPIAGLKDMEGIAHIEGETFALADERSRRICWIRLNADTRELDVSDMAQLELGILQGEANRGFEGLAWDAERQRLLVVNEKNPVRVIEISSFPAEQSRAEHA